MIIKMINVTEDVCLLVNWNHDISLNVENSEQHLLLQDPYDSIWLKIIAFFSYFIGFIASSIMLAFINYEKGHHGNFRTVINQLLSNFYIMVSFKCHYLICRVRWHPSFSYIWYLICFQGIFYAIVIFGLNVLRVLCGPLPIFLCDIAGFLNGYAILFAVITIAMCTFTKFMFVCIWKRMKQMDDNIVVRIATIQAIVMSLLFNTATWLQLQGQPFVFPVRFIYSCFACFFLKGSLLDSTKLQCLKDFIQLITICFRSVVEFSWSQMSLNKDFLYLNSFIFPASSL